ncbi:MAG: RNase adapter RapZ [Deltaproteobacteria bacterium]|nr:RNase adapter RapZ [Deltaproteobacteria bacterium]
MRVILISGLSGSGKTTAIKALEDIGFYCVDNLPVLLLPKFLELCEQSGGKILKVAVVKDIRGEGSYPASPRVSDPSIGDGKADLETSPENAGFLKDSLRVIRDLRMDGYRIEILFLESSDTVLMRRFSETRREHPLALGGSIRDGLQLERKRLQFIRDMANQVIDTSELSVHQLKEKVQEYAQGCKSPNRMTVTLLSFGYSFGIPFESDMLMDVRFLPNPYFIEELRQFKGDDPNVSEYVLHSKETKEFLGHITTLIRFLLPLYQKEMKTHLTIAIGCTGGRHRSVVIVNRLAEILRDELAASGIFLSVQHRDMEKV